MDLLNNALAALRAKWYLRRAVAVGPKARIWGRPRMAVEGQLRIGASFQLLSTAATTEIAVAAGGRFLIGDRAYINYGCSFYAGDLIRIGDRCLFGTHVICMDNDFHYEEPELRFRHPPSRPIIVEDDVWVGARVTILKGVTIGRQSVIAAGSVVARDIPAGVVAAGVPARVMRPVRGAVPATITEQDPANAPGVSR
ncbi:Transferase hexapeptide repeat containing protein [Candidatus Defluviicoccus seviourii]|uniref:Transferase hexapeptide repeat containing protein n=1 Tax=Candidatus Defluviicoccus seviourii TaxID=2565273 RepID=A0A564W9S8_9PROT|nr:Transferase hexapeptide repeat containing protein [Candidatus Defluviicoccus seviourii]